MTPKMRQQHAQSLKAAIKVKTSKHHQDPKETKKKSDQQNVPTTNSTKSPKKRRYSDISMDGSPQNKPSHSKVRLKNVSLPKKHKKRRKSWRDYLDLYDGKENLAQLHFESLEALKRDVIEKCVEEECKRILEMRRSKKADKKQAVATRLESVNRPRTKHKKKVIEQSEPSSDESLPSSPGITDMRA